MWLYVVSNVHMNGQCSRRNISRNYIQTHSKISVFQLAKEFPFNTCANHVICVAKYKVFAVKTSQSLYGALGSLTRRHGL